MELQATSHKMMPIQVAEPALPHRAILALSLFFGILGIACLKIAGSESALFGISLGVLLVSVLPWLVVLRRRFWRRRFPDGGRWMTFVSAILWISLLIGPLVTGSVWAWTQFSGAVDGMERLSDTLGTLVFGVVSFSTAYCLATMALLIQIWRDRWRAKLTGVTVAVLFLLFVVYAFVISPSKPRAEQAVRGNGGQAPSFASLCESCAAVPPL
jgi:hypothetical protein